MARGVRRPGRDTAHEALGSGPRPVALLVLEPTECRKALEDVLVDAGFDVRHVGPGGGQGAEAPTDGLAVSAAAGPGALVLLGGVTRPDERTPAAVAALRAAGSDLGICRIASFEGMQPDAARCGSASWFPEHTRNGYSSLGQLKFVVAPGGNSFRLALRRPCG